VWRLLCGFDVKSGQSTSGPVPDVALSPNERQVSGPPRIWLNLCYWVASRRAWAPLGQCLLFTSERLKANIPFAAYLQPLRVPELNEIGMSQGKMAFAISPFPKAAIAELISGHGTS